MNFLLAKHFPQNFVMRNVICLIRFEKKDHFVQNLILCLQHTMLEYTPYTSVAICFT